jgi:hypothetical protein
VPYKSAKQERWAHTPSAKKAGFPTAEFDAASKGMKLPEHAKHKPIMGHRHIHTKGGK